MLTETNNNPESRINRSRHFFSLASLSLLVVMIVSTFFAITYPGLAVKATSPTSFSFTAVSDYGQTSQTTANLNYIAGSGASFNLGLGDFNYNANVTPAAWSTYAKSHLPANFPFEIISGTHDAAQIDAYATNLPDRIGNVSGTYAKEYYFDYPPSTPLARFIMISPTTLPGYNYNLGGADYTWVAASIDSARAANIPWVIVGMHEYCFVIGNSCTNQDLLDLLLSKNVDLILQGHQRNYQSSKQLALNPTTCPTLAVGSYNPNCVVSAKTNLTKGAGSVIVVNSAGGQPLQNIQTTDPQTGYFRTWMGSNVKQTWGVSNITVSTTQMAIKFVGTSGGKFSDSFTISNSTGTPPPVVSPSPTVVTSLAQDTFARPNQAFWGTASDGNTWGANANSFKVFSINNNTGQVAATASTNYYATLGATATDAEVQFTGSINTFTGSNMGAVLRWTNSSNWYEAFIDGTNLTIEKKVAGTLNKLKSTPFSATPGTQYTLLFSVVGSTLSASAWTGTTPPANWMVSATDSTLTAAGSSGLHVVVQANTTVSFNSFNATSQP